MTSQSSHGYSASKQNMFQSRSSPPILAHRHPEEILIGNDGQQYISKPTKKGVYRWVKYKTSTTSNTTSSKIIWVIIGIVVSIVVVVAIITIYRHRKSSAQSSIIYQTPLMNRV